MSANFLKHFATIEDPRIDRCKRHELMDILFLSICAVLSNAEGWEDIEDFGHSKLDWLRKYLPFANGIPKHDTIARVLSRLDASSLQQSFFEWIKELVTEVDGDIIAIDGKAARRSFETKGRRNPLHVVSAWSCENGIVMGQRKVADKSNEITAIPVLLDILELKGATVTIDAMGCQKEIAKKIIKKQGDYVLALKGNQGTLAEEVKAWFHKARREHFKDIGHDYFEATDQGHGRIEVRRCTQIELDLSWLTKGTQWAGLATAIEVESERHIDGQTTTEKRYYISSHQLNAERVSSIVRNHWAVENKLHWVLDVTFREDESRIRRGNGAEVMNALRKISLNLIKLNTTRQASMKRKRKLAALDDDFRAEILLGQDL